MHIDSNVLAAIIGAVGVVLAALIGRLNAKLAAAATEVQRIAGLIEDREHALQEIAQLSAGHAHDEAMARIVAPPAPPP